MSFDALREPACQILHIDFGDCFEVAMDRGKFPERIPFRLTRMLVNAMEVGPNLVLITSPAGINAVHGAVEFV